ncbi:MAG: hypothetical protein HETSPECPRED_003636 [Heterodermia speciosa]|uniref:Uncharacterized protein n=1 Tax=Heterodermia speciosa TaxID=116794 RepID=A0A8H3PJ77_9LECA|nr:MAG: hypothetical protein HETSPECPRED_003636 [Heterodermia speciosa]
MDLESGRRVFDDIMNNPAYDSSDEELDETLRSGDQRAFLKLMGIGKPGGLPPPSSFPSPDEVRSQARALSKAVLDQWHFLNGLITKHENTIQKRWVKKTREQRRKILLSAWPNMPVSHRPDLEDFFKNGTRRQTRTPAIDFYKWPYINLEDLLKSKLLLLFLNSRGRYMPDAFARADLEACNFGITTGTFMPAYLNEYVMLFADRHSDDTYGELIAWNDHPEAFNWMMSKYATLPGQGLLLLEIQRHLYGFLVKCSKEILHDMPEEAMTDTSLPVQPEPPSVSANEKGLAALATTAAEAPYRLPAHLDLKSLASLVKAKLSAAEDHVCALREDPSYFADTILEWKEHRQECLPDTRGRAHPVFTVFMQEPVFWGRVIGNAITSAFAMAEMWGSVYAQIVDLQQLTEKHAKDITPEKELPEEYALAFYKLDHHLQQFVKGPIGTLKVGFVASPPMRPVFAREPPRDKRSTKIAVIKRDGLPKDESRDKLIWIFMTMFDDRNRHLAGLNTLIDELERMMENDPKSKTRISSWMADQIADLSVLSQCLHQIELFQPWAATFGHRMMELEDELTEDYMSTQKNLEGYFACQFGSKITTLGTPNEGRFYYPVDKRKTRDNTDAMIRSEKMLDEFWLMVDRELLSRKALSPRMSLFLSQRIPERTPEWIEPAKPSQHNFSEDDTDALNEPLSDLHFRFEHSSERIIIHDWSSASKAKVKTRGAAPLPSAATLPETVTDKDDDTEPRLSVSPRAHKVFNTLFYVPSTSSQPGELAWTDFLHALTSIGFIAEKLYGSVWQFTPTKLDVEQSIQFHEPHPKGKIAFTKARGWGRRLSRAYGWSGTTFVTA